MQATKMEADELIESDRKILDELQKGRCTPAVLVDWTGLSKQTIHNRLNVLVAAGHVEKPMKAASTNWSAIRGTTERQFFEYHRRTTAYEHGHARG